MKALMNDHENRLEPDMCCCEIITPSNNLNNPRDWRGKFKKEIFSFLLLLTAGLFSSFAHSTDPRICTPANGVIPEVHLHVAMQALPAGSAGGNAYYDPTPVITPGLITCSTYTPQVGSVYSFDLGGSAADSDSSNIPIGNGQGFRMRIELGTTPGYTFGVGTRWGISESQPNLTGTYYPGVIIFSGPVGVGLRDITITDQLVGYIGVTGQKLDSTLQVSDTENLTAVYVSGYIAVPPSCNYYPDKNIVTMPDHFASDFSAVSAGSPVGTPTRMGGKVECSGGSTAKGGVDLVHMSFMPYVPGDGQYIAGIQGMPEVGIKILDDAGNPLLLNGADAISMTTVADEVSPNEYIGGFDFPLQFQLVSRTGTAPTKFGHYNAMFILNMSID
ncbi:fimbrial protein [Obesumbacterium proteus]|uniref:fimbrial protein n=1 Tax=Obesumbacterium proteus TaxID=82983 RepID=UPI00242D58C2|nr:fimbrial protein [Obesumbacterium proteus]